MNHYEELVKRDLVNWQKKMLRHPSMMNRLSKNLQTKLNSYIPEKVHVAITTALKQTIRVVLFGAKYTAVNPPSDNSFEVVEKTAVQRIEFYRTTAAVEGGITGAGGILLGLADFPILIGIKLKLLFDLASIYGFNIKDYKERIYLLHIFELAFSSDMHRRRVYLKMTDWDTKSMNLPEDINHFDWRNFQQEYRDYIDLAKMAQMIPIIGAPVGAIVNYRLIKKLGYTAMNAYRMRKEIGK